MFRPGSIVRQARTALGMTQMELAHASGVSLPSVQNIEGDRANPSLSTLEAVFGTLGLEIGHRPRAMDWDALAACGAPLLASGGAGRVTPNPDLLVASVRSACAELAAGGEVPDRERKQEALGALLLAIQRHFPRFFSRHLEASDLVRRYLPHRIDGRTVKLVRQSVAVLAGYL